MNKIDLATGGLALCYLVNDGEELFTYRSSSRWAFSRLPAWVPLPDEVRKNGWSQAHVNAAVALIGIHWVGASLAGRRSGGRSAWFQNATAAWGLHGFIHLGLCAIRGGYVSGAVTAPLVIGYGAWAWRILRQEAVPRRGGHPPSGTRRPERRRARRARGRGVLKCGPCNTTAVADPRFSGSRMCPRLACVRDRSSCAPSPAQ